MNTAAQAIPALEVSAPDDNMDVLSDTGFDFGDGDIDLELDTAPSVHDEDMSLNDAGTDGGIDMHEETFDQDDFMADNGDLIEEDEMYNNDGAAGDTQIVDEGSITFEADMLAPPDEDLIDYSDDEAEQQIKMHSPSVHEEDTQAFVDTEITSITNDDLDQTQHDEQPYEPAEVLSQHAQVPEVETKTLDGKDAGSEHHSADARSQHDDVEEDHTHAVDGGVLLPTDEHSHDGDEAVAGQINKAQQDVGDDSDSNESHALEIELRPVTVNYAGNELWLFKQHDLDESGDFLLEDLSVAKSSISDVFQACRLSLGDDVSGEHEIGFRFDNLHGLELYEDNTACVAVSLERLVDLYHTLQAQDENEDPECFYVTLQFRPRFATLLADVAQYAEQGSGYSALNAAVAAGETHFSNVFPDTPVEHEYAEWDDEEADDDEASSPGIDRSVTAEEQNADERDNHLSGAEDQEKEEKEQDEQEEEEQVPEQEVHKQEVHKQEVHKQEVPEQEVQGDVHDHDRQGGVSLEDLSNQTRETQDEAPHDIEVAANPDLSQKTAPSPSDDQVGIVPEPESEAVAEQYSTEPQDERTPDQIAHDKQEADDFVDYSDDEDDEVSKSILGQTPSPSPSSATVQGDEPTEVEESGAAPELGGPEEQDDATAGFDDDDDATLLTQTQYGNDADHYAFQDYTETYEQGDPFRDLEADGTEGNPFGTNEVDTGDTNQYFDFQETDREVGPGFNDQAADDDEHDDSTLHAVEDNTQVDAFLDFEDAPEWAVDADPASNLPGEDAVLLHDNTAAGENDEGGAVEQDVDEIYVAADSASTSSNNHGPLSSHGRKRSIDEVGDGIDDAPDSTGMVSCSTSKRPLNADSSPDAKRPRV
jgi:hypothetical protein